MSFLKVLYIGIFTLSSVYSFSQATASKLSNTIFEEKVITNNTQFKDVLFNQDTLYLQQKTKGSALLVGIPKTDIPGYDDIKGVDKSISKISTILNQRGFDDVIIKTKDVDRTLLFNMLKEKLERLKPNDLFVFYFIGHGNQNPNIGHDKEEDNLDEFLVLKDKILLDDDIFFLLQHADKEARIVFIIEACHSGTTYKLYEKYGIYNEELSFPNFIYYGASNDINEAILYREGGIFTDKIYRLWKRRNGRNMSYSKVYQKVKYLKQKPVFKTEYANQKFINQLFLKI